MARKKYKYREQIFENVEIIDAGSEGNSVARVNDLVVFVKGAVPGDNADIQITREHRRHLEAKIIQLNKASENRVVPKCNYFGTCGGCKWQNLSYSQQLYYKQKQVFDAFTRIGKLDFKDIQPILASKEIYNYRNKLEFAFSNKMWLTEEQIKSKEEFPKRNALGFHLPGMFDKILDINQCHLQEEPSNAIRNFVREYCEKHHYTFFDNREQQGLMRSLIIRSSSIGEWMVIVMFYENDSQKINALLNAIAEAFPQISSLMYIINTKRNDSYGDLDVHLFNGKDHMMEEMEGLKFKIGPKSFYQTNSYQAYELYKVARDFAQLKGKELVYDLYTGIGTIANFVAKYAQKVVGVEYVQAAIEDAKINSEINGIKNTLFFAGDMKDVLTSDFISLHGKPDVVITDPPRAGMHESVTQRLLEMESPRIVYVSCNAATQARDLQLLSQKYEIKKVQPVDMFPQTHHVENVVLLELKK
jgi:23S rRNA (uracil1939-C5)-methyltransferase